MPETQEFTKHGFITKAEDITPAVMKAMGGAENPRLRQVMEAFIRHMHDFVREVKPTDEEFEIGIDFLNGIGKATTDKYNDAVLFSDVFGISSLVKVLNNGVGGPLEPAHALLGPFWRLNTPLTESGGSIVRSPTEGPALFAHVRTIDTTGAPIPGVEVDVWHASSSGMYDVQDSSQAEWNLRGKFISDADGYFSFRSIKPVGYPIPTHGPSGAILIAQKRKPQRPAHIHFLAHKQGYQTLINQIFLADDPDIERDVTFGVTPALIGDFVRHTGKAPADDVTGAWYSLEQTLVLAPGESVLPKPPID